MTKKFGSSKFKKIINRGGWNKEQEPGGVGGGGQKNQKINKRGDIC